MNSRALNATAIYLFSPNLQAKEWQFFIFLKGTSEKEKNLTNQWEVHCIYFCHPCPEKYKLFFLSSKIALINGDDKSGRHSAPHGVPKHPMNSHPLTFVDAHLPGMSSNLLPADKPLIKIKSHTFFENVSFLPKNSSLLCVLVTQYPSHNTFYIPL